jgi:hypothetical protein
VGGSGGGEGRGGEGEEKDGLAYQMNAVPDHFYGLWVVSVRELELGLVKLMVGLCIICCVCVYVCKCVCM